TRHLGEVEGGCVPADAPTLKLVNWVKQGFQKVRMRT
ncbi:hypothetical protein A2U01_0067722, partial [Trifolium medium]|nr:hypothetical protein [Trifolium medium]